MRTAREVFFLSIHIQKREKRSLISSLVSRGDVMFFWDLPANVETLVGSFRVFGWDHTFQWFGQAAEL